MDEIHDHPGFPLSIPDVTRIYTDGSCNNHLENKPMGAGVVLDFGPSKVKVAAYYSPSPNSTNNRAEMQAVIAGLMWMPRRGAIEIYSDSEWLIKTMLGEYKAKKNLDLFAKIHELCAGRWSLSWFHIRGHQGHPENEQADSLANWGRIYGGEKCRWVAACVVLSPSGEVVTAEINESYEYSKGAIGTWQPRT